MEKLQDKVHIRNTIGDGKLKEGLMLKTRASDIKQQGDKFNLSLISGSLLTHYDFLIAISPVSHRNISSSLDDKVFKILNNSTDTSSYFGNCCPLKCLTP